MLVAPIIRLPLIYDYLSMLTHFFGYLEYPTTLYYCEQTSAVCMHSVAPAIALTMPSYLRQQGGK